jgi:hypothetical protein
MALEKNRALTKKQLETLKMLDFDTLSPKKAFDILWEFKQ